MRSPCQVSATRPHTRTLVGAMAATYLQRPRARACDASGMSAKTINCECGEIVRADSDDELVAKVGSHAERDHPELVGRLSRDDVLAMAEDA